MLCPNCQTENRDGAKFCDECGSPLKPERTLVGNDLHDEPTELMGGPVDEEGESLDEQADKAQVAEVQQGAEAKASNEDEPSGAEALEAHTEAMPEMAPGDALQDATEMLHERSAAAAGGALPADGGRAPDLAGFDRHSDDFEEERLIDASVEAVKVSYRDGGTLQMPRVEGEEAPKSKEYLASRTAERKPHGKLVAGIVIAVVAIAAIVAFATYQMQLWGGKVVPDVTGMTEADARGVLLDSGFEVRVEQLKSDDTEGLVLLMDPGAGTRIEEGSEVVINIATTRTIPKVVGKTREEAAKALAEAGYENVKFKDKRSDKEQGTVLSVKPKAGQRAKSSAEVVVKVATPFVVPDVAGLYVGDAITEIENAGLGYEVVYYNTDGVPEGTVVNTDPPGGTIVNKGAYIVLNVAQSLATVLEDAASAYLADGNTVTINGSNYVIDTLQSVNYLGNNAVAYTVTARPYIYLLGEMLTPSGSETLSGTIVFTDDGTVAALS